MDDIQQHYKQVIESVEQLFDKKRSNYWTIAFPGECGQHVQETWSEEQIMQSSWYRNWVYKMVQANKHSLMTEQNAIDDWVTVHWAIRTDEWGNKL